MEMEDDVQEVPEYDPLTTSNSITKSENLRPIMKNSQDQCQKSLEEANESKFVEKLNSFLSLIRRDLGSKDEEERKPDVKPHEVKRNENVEQKLSSFLSHIRQNLSGEVSEIVENGKNIKKCKAEVKISNGVRTRKKLTSKDESHCRYCQHDFKSKKQRQCHEKNVHPKTQVLCDVCGQETNIRRYSAHMKRHTNIREFECPICSKKFKGQSDVKRHVTDIHENTKDFVCDICGKRIRSKKSMRKHMIQFHMSQLALRCSECDRPFGDKARLTRHMIVHKRERGEYIEVVKAFECLICHKMFGTNTHLKQHMGKHASEKKFGCNVCPAKFNFNSSLRNHQKKVHEGKVSVRKSTKKVVKSQNPELKIEPEVKEEVKMEIYTGPITIITNDSHVVYQIQNANYQF